MKKRIISIVLMALLSLTCLSVSVSADDEKDVNALMEQANAFLDAEKYEAAIPLLEEAAELGNAEAQYNLGACYYYGLGIDQDYEKAVEYYLLAADQGYDLAQHNLGICYYYGQGVEQDYEKSIKYYRLAADQGLAPALHALGCCYYYGEGVEQDYEKAVEYYLLAADQGHDLAQDALGYCYEYGQGVDQDYDKAIKYYMLAVEQGLTEAMFGVGDCYYYKEDWETAAKWFQKAIEAGYEPDEEDEGHIAAVKEKLAAQTPAKSPDTGEKNYIWLALLLVLVCAVGLISMARKAD